LQGRFSIELSGTLIIWIVIVAALALPAEVFVCDNIDLVAERELLGGA
jgi:hypothetical protein